jgi:hypothetical protein
MRGMGLALDRLSPVIFYEPDQRDRAVAAHDPFKAGERLFATAGSSGKDFGSAGVERV